MGGGSYVPQDFDNYIQKNVAGKSQAQVQNNYAMPPEFDPNGITLRESRDSDEHPRSTAISVFGDVTGSMGVLAFDLLRNGLDRFMREVYDRKPVTDPQILVGAIGDGAMGDQAPLQVSQWESDVRVAQHLQRLYVEKGGGGNGAESYTWPWWFLANRTSIDCFEKRGEKGVVFTYGDEGVPGPLTVAQAKHYLNADLERDLTAEELLQQVQRTHHVYHLMIEETGTLAGYHNARRGWLDLLGENAIPVADQTKLPEIMVSIIELVYGGKQVDQIVQSWSDPGTALVVAKAMEHSRTAVGARRQDSGLVRL